MYVCEHEPVCVSACVCVCVCVCVDVCVYIYKHVDCVMLSALHYYCDFSLTHQLQNF